MKSFIICSLLFISISWNAGHVLAQSISFMQEIQQDSAVDLFLTLDWKSMEKNKKEKSYAPCQVSLITANQDSLILPARAKTRGNMRLQICSFPPIKLKFDKSDLARYGLSSMNEMDIVHHCDDSDYLDQCLLKEYLAYKLWELISPYHFKSQLLRLHYYNEDGSQAHESSYAFLVENTEELVDRLDGKRNKTKTMSRNAVEKEAFLTMCLFQFMIGNTDWFIQNRHNLEFIALPGHSLLVPVPYDFDYAGLVDAPYAAHHESLKLPSVEIRYYQGWCHTEEEVKAALKIFHKKKDSIMNMPFHIQGMSDKTIKQTRAYLEDFFDVIESPSKFKNQIMRHCDMWPVRN